LFWGGWLGGLLVIAEATGGVAETLETLMGVKS
jgi:hypothetical protein